MKAIVIGGGGIMALALLVYLKDQKDISEVLVTDIKEDLVKDRVKWISGLSKYTRFKAGTLDATNYGDAVTAIKGYDIVLNCAHILGKYFLVTKTALEAGANYLDSGSYGDKEAQLELNNEFNKKGLVAVPGMYYAPGLTNIAAAYAIERLDRTDIVDIKWAIIDIVPASEHSRQLHPVLSWYGYLQNYHLLPAVRWENGKRIELPPRHGAEMFTFKGPIGTTEIAGWPGHDVDYLARSFPEIPYLESKHGLGIETERKLTLLKGLGFCQTEPSNIDNQAVSPWEILKTLLDNQPPEGKKQPDVRHGGCAIVRGVRDGKKIEYRVEAWPSEPLVQMHKDIGCSKYGRSGGIFRVGSPMGSAAVLIARGRTKGKGVFYPELAFSPEEFLAQEASMGINIEIVETLMM